ncbi:MAG: T9SS type A sorting domain-containing protein [Chlorobi bacterium]|nr:T9SS type A sorting domain-containing protein [Chlorobiota bacterium]
MKKLAFLIIFFTSVNVFGQDSLPDEPITPQEWIKNMNYGSWWIFTPPNESDNWIYTDNYSPRILDSLQALGINGGRLQWQASDDFDETLHIPQYIIDFYDEMIDDMMERHMSICLMVHFTEKDMSEEVKQRTFNGWRQVCEAFQYKSHYLAISPVIEFHGWEDFYLVNGDTVWSSDPDYDKQVRIDSLNWLYDSLTVIFREYNPTRIMSYKPYASARRADFDELTFPFGNDPGPHSGEPIYYMASMSGGYGLGDWFKWSENMDPDTLQIIKEQTMRAGLDGDRDEGLHKAINYRDTSDIQFWVDHWDPAFWKRYFDDDGGVASDSEHWTIEQNLAYIKFFTDTLKAIGTAGAGMQTNKFWNDIDDDLIRLGDSYYKGYAVFDTMSVEMMNLLKSFKEDITTSVKRNNYTLNLTVYPNPATEYFYINLPIDANVTLYDMSGNKILQTNKRVVQLDDVSTGIYLVLVKDNNGQPLGISRLTVRH